MKKNYFTVNVRSMNCAKVEKIVKISICSNYFGSVSLTSFVLTNDKIDLFRVKKDYVMKQNNHSSYRVSCQNKKILVLPILVVLFIFSVIMIMRRPFYISSKIHMLYPNLQKYLMVLISSNYFRSLCLIRGLRNKVCYTFELRSSKVEPYNFQYLRNTNFVLRQNMMKSYNLNLRGPRTSSIVSLRIPYWSVLKCSFGSQLPTTDNKGNHNKNNKCTMVRNLIAKAVKLSLHLKNIMSQVRDSFYTFCYLIMSAVTPAKDTVIESISYNLKDLIYQYWQRFFMAFNILLCEPFFRFALIFMASILFHSFPNISYAEGWRIGDIILTAIKIDPENYPDVIRELTTYEQMNGVTDPNSTVEASDTNNNASQNESNKSDSENNSNASDSENNSNASDSASNHSDSASNKSDSDDSANNHSDSDLSLFERIYLRYFEHWVYTFYRLDPDNAYNNLSANQQMNGSTDSDSSSDENVPAREESLKVADPENTNSNQANNNNAASQNVSGNVQQAIQQVSEDQALIEDFIEDVQRLVNSLETHLVRAGNHTGLVIQAGQRALDSVYPGMSQEDSMNLINQLGFFDLSQFGSSDTMAHLMTTLSIKARATFTEPDIFLRAYPKAYNDILDMITNTYYTPKE